MRTIRTILAAAATVLLLTCAASSKTITADGVVIFTQADVNAGGITPGDTPGFPATLSVSGNYRLGSALTLTSLKNGIVVAAPAVKIDMNGFKLSGAGVGRTGIVSDQIDTTVSNGIVRGFTVHGIDVRARYAVVSQVQVTKNGNVGITAGSGADFMRVAESTIAENDSTGIYCATGCLVQASVVADNGGSGIYVNSEGNFVDNIISSNGSFGINASDLGSGSGFGNNTIVDNNAGSVNGNLTQNNPNTCVPAC